MLSYSFIVRVCLHKTTPYSRRAGSLHPYRRCAYPRLITFWSYFSLIISKAES